MPNLAELADLFPAPCTERGLSSFRKLPLHLYPETPLKMLPLNEHPASSAFHGPNAYIILAGKVLCSTGTSKAVHVHQL